MSFNPLLFSQGALTLPKSFLTYIMYINCRDVSFLGSRCGALGVVFPRISRHQQGAVDLAGGAFGGFGLCFTWKSCLLIHSP